MVYHRKKLSGHVGAWTRVVGISEQKCLSLDHHASLKRIHQVLSKATLSLPFIQYQFSPHA